VILIKKILLLSVLSIYAVAGVINGVAIKVDDEIITLYDIDEVVYSSKISKEEAIELLINQKVKDRLIKSNNIKVDYFMVQDRVEQIAKSNGLSLPQFKAALAQQFIEYDAYLENIKNSLINEQLFRKVAYGSIIEPSDDEIKLFYENNIADFTTTDSFDMIQYFSKDRAKLEEFVTNPLRKINSVQKSDLRVKSSKLDKALVDILNSTPAKNFTTIIPVDGGFALFYIVQKHGEEIKSFESVKEFISKSLMDIRANEALKESFDRAKANSKIEYIR
jgi:parvulin-like peptidyl-prolyl isomerase